MQHAVGLGLGGCRSRLRCSQHMGVSLGIVCIKHIIHNVLLILAEHDPEAFEFDAGARLHDVDDDYLVAAQAAKPSK